MAAAVLYARLTAVHLCCDMCGETARIPVDGDIEATFGPPARAWISSHLLPRIVDVEATTTWVPPGNVNPVS